MEMDELRAGWSVLNERLAQNEILNKRIIKEMVTNKTQSAYERLFRFDLFTLVVGVALCILFPVMDAIGDTGMKPASFILLEGTLIIALAIQILLFSFLARFNMEKKKICDLSRLVLRYKLWNKRNYTYGTIFALIVIVMFFFIQRTYLLPDAMARVTHVAVALFLGSFIAYYQIRFYRKNIRVIEKGLEELKEFEAE